MPIQSEVANCRLQIMVPGSDSDVATSSEVSPSLTPMNGGGDLQYHPVSTYIPETNIVTTK